MVFGYFETQIRWWKRRRCLSFDFPHPGGRRHRSDASTHRSVCRSSLQMRAAAGNSRPPRGLTRYLKSYIAEWASTVVQIRLSAHPAAFFTSSSRNHDATCPVSVLHIARKLQLVLTATVASRARRVGEAALWPPVSRTRPRAGRSLGLAAIQAQAERRKDAPVRRYRPRSRNRDYGYSIQAYRSRGAALYGSYPAHSIS